MLIKSILIGLFLFLIPIGERIWPSVSSSLILSGHQHSAAAIRRLGRNLGLFLLTSLTSLLIVVPVTSFGVGHAVGLRPEFWQGGLGLVLDVLVLDCWIYWWHRANHEIPFLWRFHRVHHLDEVLDSSSALRFHFGEVALSAIARLPIVVMFSVPLANVAIFEGLILCSAIFHHSTLYLPKGFEAILARVVVTPSIHWVHHHRERHDTNSNYGTIFSFWDPVFRSRSATRRWRQMPIGIEGDGPDQRLPALLSAPFRLQPRRNWRHSRSDGS